MKKVLIATAFALLGIQFSLAQVVQGTHSTTSGGDLRFGAKVGFLGSDLFGDGIVDNTPLPGFQFGGAVEMPLTDELYFAPELLISFQGTGSVGDNIRLGYLNFPLMGKYHITEEFAAEFGPQLGFLFSDNLDDFNLEANPIDLGLGIGGGYRMDDHLYFQLRFNMGFLKVIKNVKAHNAALQLGGIYYF